MAKKRGRLRRILRWSAIGVAGLVVLLAGILLAGFLRLERGPISLEFLRSRVEGTVNELAAPMEVRYDEAWLTWSGLDDPLEIRVRGFRLVDGHGRDLGELSEVGVQLGTRALFRGEIDLVAVALDGVQIRLVRETDGSISLGIETGAKANDDGQGLNGQTLLDAWLRPPAPGTPLGNLTRVRLADANLTVEDRAAGLAWGSEDADLTLDRDEEGIHARLELTTTLAENRAHVAIDGNYTFSSRRLDGTARIDGIVPALLSGIAPGLEFLNVLDRPIRAEAEVAVEDWIRPIAIRLDVAEERGEVSGRLEFVEGTERIRGEVEVRKLKPWLFATAMPELAPLGRVRFPVGASARFDLKDLAPVQVAFEVEGGAGRLSIPELYDEPIRLRGIRLAGSVAGMLRDIRLDDIRIDLDDLAIDAVAGARPDGDGGEATLEATIAELEVGLIERYWPEIAAPEAREWVVSNVTHGVVRNARVELGFRLDDLERPDVEIPSLAGSFAFRGLTVDPLPPLDAITGVDGEATFDLSGFEFRVYAGEIGDIVVDEAHVAISGLDAGKEMLEVEARCRSPLPAAVSVLVEEPLAIVDRSFLSPAAVRGSQATALHLSVPLSGRRSGEVRDVAVRTELDALEWDDTPLLGLSVTAGEMLLTYREKRDRLEVRGRAAVAGVPLVFDYAGNLGSDGEVVTRVHVEATMDETEMARLGLPQQKVITGPVGFVADFTGLRDGRIELSAEADLTNATVDVPQLVWHKPAGVRSLMSLAARKGRKDDWEVRKYELDGPCGLLARGRFSTAPGRLHSLVLERLDCRGTDLMGSVTPRPEGGYGIRVEGGRLNLATVLEVTGGGEEEPDAGPGEVTTETDDVEEEKGGFRVPPFAIGVRLGEVRFGKNSRLGEVDLDMRWNGSYLTRFRLRASAGEDDDVRMRYGPSPRGYDLDLTTENAGEVLQSLGLTSTYRGGELNLTANRPALGDPLTGEIEIRDLWLLESPAAAKVLQIGSLRGLAEALQDDGLSISLLKSDLSWDRRFLAFEDAVIHGSGFGVAGSGRLDVKRNRVAIEGTVAPIGTLQRMFGKIPLLGTLLTGTDKTGIIATLFTIEGPVADPTIDVNAMSTLTPGIMRDLFRLAPKKKGETDEDEEEKTGESAEDGR